MTISYIDMGDVSSQDNKDYLIVSTINKIIKNQNNIGKIIDDKIIYHTSHIDDDITEIEQNTRHMDDNITEIEQKYHDLNLKINEIIENQIMLSQKVDELTKPIEDMEDADADARCKCKKEPQIAPNNDDGIFINDGTFILMKTDQLKHIINTLTLLIYLHISQSLYAKYETQTRNPPLKIIKKLSMLYNCNEEYILYQEGTPPLNQQMFHNKKMDLQTIVKMNKICLNLQEMIRLYENQQHLKQVKE